MLENKEYDFLPGKQIYTLRCSGCGNEKDYKSLNGFMPLADISDPTKLKMLVGDCQECKGQHYFYFSNIQDISIVEHKQQDVKSDFETAIKKTIRTKIEELQKLIRENDYVQARFKANVIGMAIWEWEKYIRGR